VKKSLQALLIVLGVLALAAVVFLLDLLRFAGTFHTFETRFAGACGTVALGGGGEDLEVDGARGVAYLSVLDRAAIARGEPVDGTVMLIDLNAEPAPRAAMAFDPPAFRPQGLSILRRPGEPVRLFVISHRAAGGHAVEIAEQNASGAFVPKETVSDAAFKSPNAIAAAGARQFYVVNDGDRPPQDTPLSDFLLRRAKSTVVYYDGNQSRIVANGLKFSAGVALSPDGTRLYVGEALARQMRVYRRDSGRGELELDEIVPLASAPDNLKVDADGVVWIAAHPRLLALVAHLRDPAERAPTQVLRFDPRGQKPAAGQSDKRLSQVFGDDGSRLSAGSGVAPWRDDFVIGAAFDHKVLICKPSP
jgi:arylesterase / paraoxonase